MKSEMYFVIYLSEKMTRDMMRQPSDTTDRYTFRLAMILLLVARLVVFWIRKDIGQLMKYFYIIDEIFVWLFTTVQPRHLCRRNLRDELETLAVVRLLGPLGGAAAHPVRVGREQRLWHKYTFTLII